MTRLAKPVLAALAALALPGCLVQMAEGEDPIADGDRRDIAALTGRFEHSSTVYEIERTGPGLYAASWEIPFDQEFIEGHYTARALVGRDCGPRVPDGPLKALCEGDIAAFCASDLVEDKETCPAEFAEVRDFLSGARTDYDEETGRALDLMRALAEFDLPEAASGRATIEIETLPLPANGAAQHAAGHVLAMNDLAFLEYGVPIMGPQVLPGSLMLIRVTDEGFKLLDTVDCLRLGDAETEPKLRAVEALPLLTNCIDPARIPEDQNAWDFTRLD